ncbi:MAG: siderophore-interacting protein, partial [Paraburkholderia tropica]
MQNQSKLDVVRVRHPLKFRLLRVVRVEALSSALVRVTLTGDLSDFVSASFDDHVKVFFPPEGASQPVLPSLGPDGIVFPEGVERPAARDYTPRRFDPVANELDIEFALHEAGPATAWAAQAQPGQYLGVGGPRGSMVIPTGFDWHLLIGDETALPAIQRRLSELPAGARVAVVAEVANRAARIELPTAADLYAIWCYREESESENPLVDAVDEVWLPPG